eukprot:GFUD01021067.1.p1 GENE.GFUD01021067.1~~GFUD01021067.1.p1  ORF type:complete len:534 (-),score=133.20 GFUD01021067.1:41-1642(-)
MEFSWDLLESTFDKVGDVLGDTISDIDIYHEMSDTMVTSDCKIPMDVINENSMSIEIVKSEVSCEYSQFDDPEVSDNMSIKSEDMLPQSRERSNTWPKRQLEPGFDLSALKQESSPGKDILPLVSEEGTSEEQINHSLGSILMPKKSSRRNPWGNYSYSDMIVQAIVTSPEQRLTLNQIYDWMISAIPYFSERQDNASSAGWKNSIRHNLSLHQKFLKVPNEDAAKSSWWTINPEKKQTIKPRRRATYGDSKYLQNKRERAKIKMESMSNNGRLVKASSTSRLTPHSPPQSMESFRIRSNSGASSCGDNRLSPFRPCSFSNASSSSQTSPLHLPEMIIPHFTELVQNVNVETDLDDIRLDDLNIKSESDISDPADILREYLHPSDQYTDENIYVNQNLTILEPQGNETVGKSVIKFANSNSTHISNMEDSLLVSFQDHDMIEKHDEERKMMIKNKLNCLIQKSLEISQNQTSISYDNKKNLESAFGIQIRLLQEELDKLERQKPEIINNPFLKENSDSVYNNDEHFRTQYNIQ